MELDDHITFITPEGVELQVSLAGAGSRCIAGALDLVLQIVLIVLIETGAALASQTGHLALLIGVLGAFVVWFFYPVLFETLAAGRTPGKRVTHLRVVRTSGAPVDLGASAIRNLIRLLDGPPLLYLPSLVTIAASARHQRPGDLAAGTVVVRESAREAPGDPGRAAPATRLPIAGRLDASSVTAEETAAVRQFLTRRESLEPVARRDLGLRLADALRPKVTGAPDGIGPEQFLELVVEHKANR